ncbi:MAG: penicillin-binding protein 1C [Myxococcales bacterium]|nr:penicillin-binding protein 1C [Myxococcales bacterium]
MATDLRITHPRRWQPGRWLAGCCAVVLAGWWLLRAGLLGPSDPRAELLQRFAVTRIVDRDGRTLQALTQEHHARHRPVALAAVSPHLVNATLVAEDRWFFSHVGVNPLAIARATLQNASHLRVISGASTLTQQVCKWVQPRPRTWWTKISEAGEALSLEGRLSKPEILELYLEFAPYGGLHRGVEQAAQAWLGKTAAALTLAESAWLAVLPRSPARLDPGRNTQTALPSQKRLLRKMRELNLCDDAQLAVALAQPIALAPDPSRLRAPHLADLVQAKLQQPLHDLPIAIHTTIDGALQRDVQALTHAHLDRLRSRGVGNGAVVVLDNGSGQVLALVGSLDYGDVVHQGANNGALARRQPGSTIKAFTYARAFEADYSPTTVLADLPAQYHTPHGTWTPGNYGGRYLGPVRARLALGSSLNLPAVQLADKIGTSALLADLHAVGLATLTRSAAHYGLGLTLGDGEVSLLDLTAAFSTFARGGVFVPAIVVTTVQQRCGDVVQLPVARSHRVYSPQSAWQVLDILSDPAAREPAFGRDSVLEFPFAVAAKTGTSKGFRDNWALASTTRYTVGVWVGNFDGSPMREVSGITGAAPLVRDIVWRLHGSQAVAPFVRPDGLHRQQLCALSGLAVTALCPQPISELLRPAQVPAACDWHRRGDPAAVVLELPPQYRRWGGQTPQIAAQMPHHDHQSMVEATPAVRPPATVQPSATLRIVQPLDGARLVLDPRLPAQQQQVGLRARLADARLRLRWTVDRLPVGDLALPEAAVLWPLTPGEHVVRAQAIDDSGRTVAADRIVVVVQGPRLAPPQP